MGETLRTSLFSAVASGGRSLLDHLPNLLTVLAIVLLTRFAVRLVTFAFRTVEEGRVTLPGVFPETAQPTRRIAVALLWIFALVLSYEFLPGAKSDAFKGVSVFIGLIISLGSTGIMNQVMSGLMVTYSRAVRVGDFVRIGDVEGTVTQLGTLSTKIKTPRNEEVTLPNALVVTQAATNFSRHADDGVMAPASVTIGYDVPWRQVQALLVMAAERTPGVRRQPAPVVLQTALGDFAVEYKVLVCVDQPHRRIVTLNALHANIQDAFNEYGVQIMSPAYEADPSERKTVPPSQWYAAPAPVPPEKRSVGCGVPGRRTPGPWAGGLMWNDCRRSSTHWCARTLPQQRVLHDPFRAETRTTGRRGARPAGGTPPGSTFSTCGRQRLWPHSCNQPFHDWPTISRAGGPRVRNPVVDRRCAARTRTGGTPPRRGRLRRRQCARPRSRRDHRLVRRAPHSHRYGRRNEHGRPHRRGIRGGHVGR